MQDHRAPDREPRADDEPAGGARPEGLDPRLVSLTRPQSFEAEQYRMLRHAVEQRQKSHGLRVLAVTSPAVGEGKSTTTVNLGGALAQDLHSRVLIVDLDLRRPRVGALLGISESAPGLVAGILDGERTLEQLVHPVAGAPGLDALPAGRAPLAPYEALKSSRLAELFRQARESYDHVLVDTPPVVVFPDSKQVESLVDAFVLVVAAHRTPRRMLDAATNRLTREKLLGLVFNEDDAEEPRAYQSYYNQYRR